MEMPTAGPDHERLAVFAGRWEGEETVWPTPFGEGGPARGRFDNRMALGGFFLITNYEETKDGVVAYRGHGVYGYERKGAVYTMHWFDSMGGGYQHPARGTWEGDSLVFRNETPQGHARYVHAVDGDTYSFRLEISESGEIWNPMVEGTYQRA